MRLWTRAARERATVMEDRVWKRGIFPVQLLGSNEKPFKHHPHTL